MGPVMRLADRGSISPDTFDTIYAPLIPLLNIPGFQPLMMWYLDLWEPHYYSSDSTLAPAKPIAPPDAKKSSKP